MLRVGSVNGSEQRDREPVTILVSHDSRLKNAFPPATVHAAQENRRGNTAGRAWFAFTVRNDLGRSGGIPAVNSGRYRLSRPATGSQEEHEERQHGHSRG